MSHAVSIPFGSSILRSGSEIIPLCSPRSFMGPTVRLVTDPCFGAGRQLSRFARQHSRWVRPFGSSQARSARTRQPTLLSQPVVIPLGSIARQDSLWVRHFGLSQARAARTRQPTLLSQPVVIPLGLSGVGSEERSRNRERCKGTKRTCCKNRLGTNLT